jgi:hypothetical protein
MSNQTELRTHNTAAKSAPKYGSETQVTVTRTDTEWDTSAFGLC